MKALRHIARLAAFLLPLGAAGQSMSELLDELDRTIAIAGDYVDEKEVRIKTIENQLNSRGVTPELQYEIYGRLFEEYMPYKYSAAVEALDRQEEIANGLAEKGKLADVHLKRAWLCTIGGMYLDAKDALSRIDTTALTRPQRLEYYNVCQRYWRDYDEYSASSNPSMLAKARYYLERILDETPQADKLNQQTSVTLGILNKNWGPSDFINRNLLAQMDPSSHEYANQAYWQARISSALGRQEEMDRWFILSAIADIKTATKDNASLFSLAQNLYTSGDMQRAFNYTQFSLDDALFFDARLRQWQIASVLPTIQKGYNDFQLEHEKKMRRYIVLLIVLVLLTLAVAAIALQLYLRQRKSSRKIEKMNVQIQNYSASLEQANASLKDINSRLQEESSAKEEYIGLFIRTCSDYIDRLKSYQGEVRRLTVAENYNALMKMSSSREMVDKAVRELFNMFDEAFLRIYPKFVDQFNALLRPEAKIELKDGELLNTELRIFALIRLGITQSSDIASFLRYSVNTIYNYRAQIKKGALAGKEDFEEAVKTLGN